MEEDTKILKKHCIESLNKHDICFTYNDADRLFNLLKELDKKDKIINEMAEQLTSPINGKEWVIDYFTKKVEGKNE